MNLAGQYWENNNFKRVRELLEETKTYPDRGFEWYYWQRQTHLELKTLRGHTEAITSVAFSPDCQWIVTASDDRSARLWETSTGKQLRNFLGHKAEVECVAFSPDGRRIVTGSADQTARIWDAASGKLLLILRGHLGVVRSAAYSTDGKRILTGSGDRTARIWDATSGKELLILKGHSRGIICATFSPDGMRVATGGIDQTIRVWDATAGTNLLNLSGLGKETKCLSFSPDGRRLLSGGSDGEIRVWEAASGKELPSLKTRGVVSCLAFSGDGKRVVAGGGDRNTAELFDTSSGEELFALRGHSSGINSVAFSSDGDWIVTGSDDHTAKVWDSLHDRGTLSLRGHNSWVWSVAISPDGKRVLSGSLDHTAKVWDVTTGRELITLPREGDIGRILGVAFFPDGRRMAIHSDHTVNVYETQTYKKLYSRRCDDGIEWRGFSADGERLIILSDGLKEWDAATGKDLKVLLKGTDQQLQAISPDERRGVAVSPTVRPQNRDKVLELPSGKELFSLDWRGGYLDPVVFSQDGQWIATGGQHATTVKVWNALNGKQLISLEGHDAGIESVAFTSDKTRIVTGSDDHTAKVWETVTGKELLTLKGHSSEIQSLAVSPDGQRIATGGYDNTVRIWEAATKEQVDAWRREEATVKESREQTNDPRSETIGSGVLRTEDPGEIKQWLVLAPIAFQPPTVPTPDEKDFSSTAVMALEREQIPDEANLHPRAGQKARIGGTELVWTELKLQDKELDFNRFLGTMTEWSLGYAVCYIQSETEQTDLVMKVVRDDCAKIYLNGKEIYRREEEIPNDESYPDTMAGVELKAGNNILVFKVANEEGGWFGSVCFTDAAGQRVKGIHVTLTPPPSNEGTR
jgi:WD40 repeat protein